MGKFCPWAFFDFGIFKYSNIQTFEYMNMRIIKYTNIQILKKALFSMFPSYLIARLHGRNAENFRVMQVSCNMQHQHTESCIYKTFEYTLSKT